MSTAGLVSHDLPARDAAEGISPTFAGPLRRFAMWRERRRAIRELSRYSDAMLKDMGISRSEIIDAVRCGRPATPIRRFH